MSGERALRWWPPVALLAMGLLGWAVGPNSTPVDDWFLRFGDSVGADRRWLLVFVQPELLAAVGICCLGVALLRRHWSLAVAVVLCPVLSIVLARVFKQLWGRELDGALAYPSGHAAALTAVAGMAIVVLGASLWVVVAAVSVTLIGALGVGLTFHYFTDAVGALLLSSAVVCAAALVVRRLPAQT